jgi:hypothetical protein
VFIHEIPIPTGIRINGSALEKGRGDSQSEGTVDDISMSGDPTDVRHACELVFRMNVKDVFDGEESAEDVSTVTMNYTLWFPRRPRGLSRRANRMSSQLHVSPSPLGASPTRLT